MSELKTNKISTNDGNNVALDDPLNLKSYTTTEMNALTSAAGDIIYNTTEEAPYYYDGSDWNVMKDIVPLTVSYLVIAGGGGGGAPWYGGGGGAGGYRTSWNSETSGGGAGAENVPTLDLSTNYTVTIGGGGAQNSSNGSDSTFSTVTSTGGGRVKLKINLVTLEVLVLVVQVLT